MSDISDYISSSINAVFGWDSDNLSTANKYLATYADQTYLLIRSLNGLCDCDFIAGAKLQNVIPTQSVVNSIYSAFSAAGDTVPTDILLRYQAGDSDIAIGTLGSFYSCISADDTNPILVATGSNTESGYILSMKQCNNWAMKGLLFSEFDQYFYTDKESTSYYFSLTSDGPCYEFVEEIFYWLPPINPVGYSYAICVQALYGDGDLL